ncbi:hypothetical protein ACF0H5_000144 [Mactra antiquata]
MANMIGFAGVGILSVTFLFAILSLSLPYWTFKDDPTQELHWGLWKYCLTISGGTKTCDELDLDTVPEDEARVIRAVRGTLFIGIIFTSFAVALAIVVLLVLKDKKILFFGAAGCAFVSGVFCMVAFAVYADEYSDNGDLHACFALDVIAWIGAWTAGGMFIAAKMFSKD